MNGEETPAPAGDDSPAPAGEEVAVPAEQVRIVVRDDLERSRLTVFFRFFLALPHLLVLGVWGLLALMMAIINWFAILFAGRTVGGDLQTRYLRYFTHVDAYLYLVANPFPGFGGEADYPIDLEAVEARRQSRWKTGFRLVLAVPALSLAGALGASGGVSAGSGGYVRTSFGAMFAAAFLAWFACLVRGRMPRGLRDLIVYGLWYSAQVAAYVLLVTDRYPNSDPLVPRYGSAPPDHPVRISADDDLRRSRLTVFFRLLLWLPHLVWLILWGVVVTLAVIANWFVTLFAGRPAGALHRFTAAYARYSTHVFAFLNLVANPFPGFVGRAGSYPIDLQIAPPARQNRWKTGFRLILVFPAGIVASALGGALSLVGLFGWFVGLFTGRMPQGLRNLGVFALRYQGQLFAYLALLTDAYPHSGPSLELPRPDAAPVPEPA
jgi:hypothetical protein